jgi:hypothetical protein
VQGVSSQMCGRLGWTRLEPSIATLRLNMFNSVAILTDDNIQVKPHCYKLGESDIHNSPPVDIILSYYNPVYIISPHIYNIHFNINLQTTNNKIFGNLVDKLLVTTSNICRHQVPCQGSDLSLVESFTNSSALSDLCRCKLGTR